MSVSPIVSAQAPAPEKENSRLRLEYLDGLRGLTALYVVLHHIYLQCDLRSASPQTLRIAQFFNYGHFAVDVFIVLSGYCLMLPVVRSADGRLRGGFWNYITRRARRILPPYYAALVLSLMMIALVPGMNLFAGVHWDISLPAFDTQTIVSHVFLYHNLKSSWMYKIDHPMWSVATEWQIYFLFPLLLPIWRRLGNIAAIVVAFAIGLAPILFLPHVEFCPWFLGLFALGMGAASLGFSRHKTVAACRERIHWGVLSACLAAVFLYYVCKMHEGVLSWKILWAFDILVGASTACLIVSTTRSIATPKSGRKPVALRLMEAKWAVWSGTFSYSLYLIHAPIIAALHVFVRSLPLTDGKILGIMLSAGLPLSIGLSYLFHLAFERRFMPGHPKTEKQAAKSASLSPAP